MEDKNHCTLYVVRHGQSQANYPHDTYGLDTELTEKGKQQAEESAKKFSALKFDAIISSPMIRAKQTADVIAAEHNLAVHTKEILRDRRFGKIEGRKVADVKEELQHVFEMRNKLPYAEWKNQRFAEDYETDEEMISRFITGLREIAVAYPGKNVLITSHVSLIRVLLIHLGVHTYKDFEGYKFENTGYIKLKSDGIDFFLEEIEGLIKK